MRSVYSVLLLSWVFVGCVDLSSDPAIAAKAAEKLTKTMAVNLGGQPLVFELKPAQVLTPGFARWRWEDGRVVRVGGAETVEQRCYFTGQVQGAPSTVVLRVCADDASDIQGVVWMDGRAYDVIPAADMPRLQPAKRHPGKCGADRLPAPDIVDAAVTTRTAALSSGQARLVEIAIFEDSKLVQTRNAGGEVADPILAVMASSLLYDRAEFDTRVLPLVTAIVDTGISDPWGQPTFSRQLLRVDPYLDLFNAWIGSSNLPAFDEATLLSGWEMEDDIVGLAVVGGACDSTTAGALVYGIGSPGSVGDTLAHELGHLLGMDHDGDGNSCAESGFVMATYFGDALATDFSTCSVTAGDIFLASPFSSCVKSAAAPAYPEARCGDGKVDAGERCDCGPMGCAGRDDCCDETTCQLRSGATCAVGDGCCDAQTCAPFDAATVTVCRAATSSCDAAEVCAGDAYCPADRVVETGASCSDAAGWDGACLLGQCVTRGGICEDLSEYYDFDVPPYAPVCGEDPDCGPMFCLSGGECVYTEDDAPDGTPCGNGRQCWEGSCMGSGQLPGADGCAEPDRDTDNDGVADCNDACPFNPDATVEPCACLDCTPAADMGDTDSDTGGDAGNDASPEANSVNLDNGADSGCSTAEGGTPSNGWIGLAGLAIMWFRRRS